MRSQGRNEIEERRVIRLLAGLADAVQDLPDDEIHRAVWSASALAPIRGPVRSRRRAHGFSAVAAAAVVALAFLVQLDARAEHASSAAAGSAPIATFPEGNALQLLLAASDVR